MTPRKSRPLPLLPLLLLIFSHINPMVQAKLCAAEPFQVLTYNIRYANPGDGQDKWDNRWKAVVKTIQQADLAGLQEVLAIQQDRIEEHTPGWQWLAVGRDDGHRKGEMCSVGWRSEKFVAVEQGTFWLSPSPFRVGVSGWDAALPRIASWVRLVPRAALRKEPPRIQTSGAEPGQPSSGAGNPPSIPTILLINTHFDHRGAEARRQSAAWIRKWISQHRGDSQVILVGDLNAPIGSPPLNELLAAEAADSPPLRDARGLSPKADLGPDSTWNGFREIVLGQRIDHILVLGDGLSIEDYQTLDPRTAEGRFASDHLPAAVDPHGNNYLVSTTPLTYPLLGATAKPDTAERHDKA
jgi:endonuclease/exonuclease/phosphatase family metal-dependent hydrolase